MALQISPWMQSSTSFTGGVGPWSNPGMNNYAGQNLQMNMLRGGRGGGGTNPYDVMNTNAAGRWNYDQNRDTIFGNLQGIDKTQAGLTERENISQGGQTERLGMQTGSNERINAQNMETQRYGIDANKLLGLRGLQNEYALGKLYDTGQTQRANIANEIPRMAEERRRHQFDTISPTLLGAVNRFAPPGAGDQPSPSAATPVPSFGGGVNQDALVNNANRGAYQAFGEGLEADAAGLSGRGFTSGKSGGALAALANQRRIGLGNQLADNAVRVPLQVQQALGPMQLQAAGIREGGRAARAREDISREQNSQNFVATLLGVLGGMA